MICRLPAALLLLALACPSCRGSDIGRTTLIRGLPRLGDATCANTKSGRWYVADDTGRVCLRGDLDYTTGCCSGGQRHSCETCQPEDRCCSSYEHCVSCCLAPANGAEAAAKTAYRAPHKPETGKWDTAFEYCAGSCRTTSKSTSHENAFISNRVFCFSELGRPSLPLPPPLPEAVTEALGEQGQSCDDACAAAGRACAPDALASLNSCAALRARFPCEAGCDEAGASQFEFPGYVVESAPKHQWPALCATLPPKLPPPRQSCGHKQAHVRRLCTCGPRLPAEPLRPGAAPDGQAAASAE